LKRSEKGLRQTLRFRKGAKPDKSPSPPAARITSGIEMPAICERCEAVFARKVWRRGRRPSNELLSQANRVTYPACEQAAGGPISGVFAIVKGVTEHRNAIERRIANVVRLPSADSRSGGSSPRNGMARHPMFSPRLRSSRIELPRSWRKLSATGPLTDGTIATEVCSRRGGVPQLSA